MSILRNLSLVAFSLPIITILSCSNDDDANTPVATTKDFTVTIENVMAASDYFQAGVFNTPDGDSSPGAATPGKSYSFSFQAGPGHYLSFATMFVQSNDLFYAPGEAGIALYDNGSPITGDITSEISLWDAGTEVNEMPGTGDNQAPRQSEANTGPAENGNVRLVDDAFTYPTVTDVIAVSITNTGTMFTVTISNVSGGSSLPTPIAPGVFVVHSMGQSPLFENGQSDTGNGMEALAEDGDPSSLEASLEANTGYTSPLAPGAYAIHKMGTKPMFENGQADKGDGLEALAEDGDPSMLSTSLMGNGDVSASGIFNTPTSASTPGPLLSGGTYTFTFTAKEGDYLSFATMLVQSNDLFYAPGESGIALFNNGTAISGDITSNISFWDAGTEVNEYPGSGLNQAPRQSGANTGTDEGGNVRMEDDEFTYPSVDDVIKVTITSN